MEINLKWKDKCGHCDGGGKCSYYYCKKDDTKERCFCGCQPVYQTKGRKYKKLVLDHYKIICKVCNGNGFILSELGEQIKLFLDEYYVPNFIEDKMRDIASEEAYREKNPQDY